MPAKQLSEYKVMAPLGWVGGDQRNWMERELSDWPTTSSGAVNGPAHKSLEKNFFSYINFKYQNSLSPLVTTLLTAGGPLPIAVEAYTEQV